jgi:hypothetical protein
MQEKTFEHMTKLLRELSSEEAEEKQNYNDLNTNIIKLSKDLSALAENSPERKNKQQELEKLNEQLKKLDLYAFLDIPTHLKKFAQFQIKGWIESGLGAMSCYERDCHYHVDESSGKIVPIDYDNTGTFEKTMVWSNGLAQMLQIKEGLRITPEGLCSNFISSYGFFKRYNSENIVGVTGTLGTKENQDYFKKAFGTRVGIIPPFKKQQIHDNDNSSYTCKELPGIAVASNHEWVQRITKSTLLEAKNGRAVLVICKYVAQVEQLFCILQNESPLTKVFTYTGKNNFNKETIDSGEVLLATNIAGRGTDIKTSNEVEKNGGLHVIITFLPNSTRVELQNAGRTARQGKKGSCQLIVFEEAGRSIEEMKKIRSQEEKKGIDSALEDLKAIQFKDELFIRYCALQREIIPYLQDEQKLKDWQEINMLWSKEQEKLNLEVLEEKFLYHCSETKRKYFEGRNNFKQKKLQERLDVIDTESKDEWISKFIKHHREHFCTKWEGKISSEVMAAFKIDSPYIRNLERSGNYKDNGVFEQKGLAEQWALWLHIHLSDKSLSHEDVANMFLTFEVEMKESAKGKCLIKNPAFFIQKGNDYLKQDKLDDAIHCFQLALRTDKEFSLFAHYNLALAHVSFKENKGFHQEQAKKHLEDGLKIIDSVYKASLLQLNTLIGVTGGGKQSSEHVKYQLDLLGEIENHGHRALHIIIEAHRNENNVKVSKVSVTELFVDDKNHNHDHSIHESELNGLSCLFTVEEKLPTPWWSIIGVFLLGIAQIVAGAILTAWTGGSLGKGLIAEGVSDLIVGVKAAISGTFSWAAYAMQKAISLAISIISSGWESIKKGFQTIKEIGNSTAKLTFKEGMKLATKQVGLALAKGVAKECINAVADYFTDKLIMDGLEAQISAKVSETLTKALENNQIIQNGLHADHRAGNNKYQNQFIKIGLSILTKEENKFFSACREILNGVLKNKVQGMTTLMNIAGVAKIMDDVLNSTDDFLHEFNSEITNLEKDINDSLNKFKTDKTTIETGNQSKTEENLEMLSTPLEIKLETHDMEFHQMSENKSFSSELNGEVTNISGGYSKLSSQSHIAQKFRVQITSKITNSIKNHSLRPLTSNLANLTVDSFTNGLEKSLEEERKTHRATCKNDWNESDLSKGKSSKSSSYTSLSKDVEEAIKSIEKGEGQGTSTAAAAAKALNKKIQIFDEKGRLIKTLGNGPGEPLKVRYSSPKDGSDAGHYEPLDGSFVTKTGETTCLLDTLASMSGTNTNDLKKEVVNVIKSNPTISNKLYENKKILEVRDASRLYKGGQVEELKSDFFDEMFQEKAQKEDLEENVEESDNEPWSTEKVEKFLSKVVRAAERDNPGDGLHKGREKHNKIHKVLEENRHNLGGLPNLKLEERFDKTGVKGRYDARDVNNKIIYDYKFGKTAATEGQTGMGKKQFDKYSKADPDHAIKTINKKSEFKEVTRESFKKQKTTQETASKQEDTEQLLKKRKTTHKAATKQEDTQKLFKKQKNSPETATKQEDTEQLFKKQKTTQKAATKQEDSKKTFEIQKNTQDTATKQEDTKKSSGEQKTTQETATKQEDAKKSFEKQKATQEMATKQEDTKKLSNEQKATQKAATKQEDTKKSSREQKTIQETATKQEETRKLFEIQKNTQKAATKQKDSKKSFEIHKTTQKVATKQEDTEQLFKKQKTTQKTATKQEDTKKTLESKKSTQETATKQEDMEQMFKKPKTTQEAATNQEDTKKLSREQKTTQETATKQEDTKKSFENPKSTQETATKQEDIEQLFKKLYSTQEAATNQEDTKKLSREQKTTHERATKQEDTEKSFENQKSTQEMATKQEDIEQLFKKPKTTQEAVTNQEDTKKFSREQKTTHERATKQEDTEKSFENQKSTQETATKQEDIEQLFKKPKTTQEAATKQEDKKKSNWEHIKKYGAQAAAVVAIVWYFLYEISWILSIFK